MSEVAAARGRERFANATLALACAASAAFLIYLRLRSGTTLNAYYALAGGGLLLYAWAFRWQTARKVNLAVYTVSLVLAIYAAEILVAVVTTGPTGNHLRRIRAAQQAGIAFDTRDKFQLVTDLRGEGVDAQLQIMPSLFTQSDGLRAAEGRIYPMAGFARKPTALCNESGEWLVYESDEHGFSNPAGRYRPGQVAIGLIGDSMTHGACVPVADNIAGRLEARGPRVLNLGMSGDGPLTQLATLTEYALPVRPEVVLWIFFEGNDLLELERERQSPILMRYLEDNFSQDLIHRRVEIDRILSDYARERERTREPGSKGFLRDVVPPIAKLWNLRVLLAMPTLPALVPEPPPPLFGDILERAQRRVQAIGGRLYFVYLPSWGRYAYEPEDDGRVGRHDDVLRVVRAAGIPTIDIHEVIRRHPDPVSLWPFRMDGHYTLEGYDRVAEAIASRLRGDGALAIETLAADGAPARTPSTRRRAGVAAAARAGSR